MGIETMPMYAAISAWCVFLLYLLNRSDRSAAQRAQAVDPCEQTGSRHGRDDALILQMLAVALRGGASIPYALRSVGSAVGDGYQGMFASVADALYRGHAWDDAWLARDIGDDGGEADDSRGKPSDVNAHASVCDLICEGLRDAWGHGASPVQGLQLAVERADRDARHEMRKAAAALSVRILLPMGLCFLPAFVALGVIPTAMSLISG